jgi:hypothetical protein
MQVAPLCQEYTPRTGQLNCENATNLNNLTNPSFANEDAPRATWLNIRVTWAALSATAPTFLMERSP